MRSRVDRQVHGALAAGLLATAVVLIGSARAREPGGAAARMLAVFTDVRPAPPEPPLGADEQCRSYSGFPPGWGTHDHAGMVHFDGGTYTPGTLRGYAEERPRGEVTVEPFWLDRTEVTNAQFGAFVAATGYVTTAERSGGGAVLRVPEREELGARPDALWRYVSGATWRHPEGPGSSAAPNAPVVQVTYEDALAYARWIGRRLPTEAEWEFAARAGLDDAALQRAPVDPGGRPTANFWQGDFPLEDRADDGFHGRAPVGCFPANAYGLYDLIGNVWEWTSDEYHDVQSSSCAALPPARAATAEVQGVIKGGSFLCAPSFCARYRATARHPQDRSMSTMHLGFRTTAPG
ncbi:formylglycine-generating enzyme family protein [Sorangium sp. So ce887]|uniref:formylglycine-generating enzyme family protein n=1 Tax=Sorangium sp. So ce887 TaxID=3133324 RepID=UPI003F5FCB39